jgi:DNA-binding NarL/FixJ family response regulator
MLSMHHTYNYLERSLRAGAIGYLLKDSAGSELVTAVRSVYQGDTYFSEPMAGFVQRFFES